MEHDRSHAAPDGSVHVAGVGGGSGRASHSRRILINGLLNDGLLLSPPAMDGLGKGVGVPPPDPVVALVVRLVGL